MRLLVALVLLAVAAVPAQSQVKPRLRPLGISPVRLSGEGFAPGERVRVRAWVGGHKRTKHVRAGDHGRFRVRFAELTRNPCTQRLRASAAGSKHHDATLVSPPVNCETPPSRCPEDQPECPAPRAQPSTISSSTAGGHRILLGP